jgi:hypothetical protein
MKKALTLFFMLAALALQAQTVTQENLQGRWRLSTYAAEGYSVDFIKQTYTISEEMRKKHDAEDIAAMENDLQIVTEMGQGMELEFKGNTLIRTQHIGSEVVTDERDFKIENGLLVLPAKEGSMQQGQSSSISIKEGNLVLLDEDVETIYSKIK